MAPERILVGRIGAAQGLRGEVRLWSFTADPMAIKDYGPLEAEDGRSFAIESLRPGKKFLVARLAGVNDRTAAEALRNLDLYVPRARLPKPAAEERAAGASSASSAPRLVATPFPPRNLR